MAPKLCLLLCQNLSAELTAVANRGSYANVHLDTFPARCGRPPLQVNEIQSIIADTQCDRIELFGGACASTLDTAAVQIHHLDQCFHLLANRELIDSFLRQGMYLVTPGWLARWPDWVADWGFDQASAGLFFAESATEILLLDTGVDPQAQENLQAFASFVDRPASSRPVGLDHLDLQLTRRILGWRLQSQNQALATTLSKGQRKTADYAMALDLLPALARTTTPEEVIHGILELFTMLFAPAELRFISDQKEAVKKQILEQYPHLLEQKYAWTVSNKGFLLTIGQRELYGILLADEITFPEYKHHYLNLALNLVGVCGLALNNAHTYQQIRRAEQQLQQYATELEQRNQEVRQFAYIVSHDLRSPLVNLKGFAAELQLSLDEARQAIDAARPHLSQAQQESLTHTLDQEVPEALHFIDAAASQMESFISAVLQLSRLGARQLRFELVDMQALADQTLTTLAHQIEKNQVQVKMGDLPVVQADRTAMEQVMGNLLGNALKYLQADRPGELTITSNITAPTNAEFGQITFHIQDNGRGIAADDMDKVFAPFRRAGRQDVPGEGMGLAYVQAIIRRHHGRIWCESELGIGSTFHFTLPYPHQPTGTSS